MTLLRHSLSLSQRKRISAYYTEHRLLAAQLRGVYTTNIENSERDWKAISADVRKKLLDLIPRNPCTLAIQMNYSFDYCQQVSLPYSSQQRGKFYFQTPQKVQVFGACAEALGRQVFFLIDKSEQIGKGSNTVVSLLHAYFSLHGLGEKKATLQADNCVGQNKNKAMIWYLA